MVHTTYYTTGSHRGYVRVSVRNIESEMKRIPEDLTGTRGNYRAAMKYLKQHGSTHYTTEGCQGVPYKGYSNQYCYTIYHGYKEEREEEKN